MGKAGKERKRAERETAEQKRIQKYIKSGGIVNCGTCEYGWRCPTTKDNSCGVWTLHKNKE